MLVAGKGRGLSISEEAEKVMGPTFTMWCFSAAQSASPNESLCLNWLQLTAVLWKRLMNEPQTEFTAIVSGFQLLHPRV